MNIKCTLLASLFLVSNYVSAQTAGTIMLKGGYNEFYPQVKSGDITGVPGGKIDVKRAGQLFGSVAYMISDNIATELSIGVPPNHDIYGAGTVSPVGKIATTDILPPGLSLQYRFFSPESSFRPYVGIGVVRGMFRNTKTEPVLTAITNPTGPATTMKIENAWGSMAQFGMTYAVDTKWFIDAAVVPTYLKTIAHLSTGQSVEAKVSPVGVNVSLGYRF